MGHITHSKGGKTPAHLHIQVPESLSEAAAEV